MRMDGAFLVLLLTVVVAVGAIIVRAVLFPLASNDELMTIAAYVIATLLTTATVFFLVSMAFQDSDIEDGPPTLEGVVEEYRITGGNDHYSGTLVVDGQRFEFTAEELPVFNVGYEYQIWMNEGRLLKYQEVSE